MNYVQQRVSQHAPTVTLAFVDEPENLTQAGKECPWCDRPWDEHPTAVRPEEGE